MIKTVEVPLENSFCLRLEKITAVGVIVYFLPLLYFDKMMVFEFFLFQNRILYRVYYNNLIAVI